MRGPALSNAAAPAAVLINNSSKYKINLTVSSQNCNSINVASSVKNMYTKISAITKLGSDIILLSDVRREKNLVR